MACRFGRLPTTRAATTATAIRDGGKLSPSSDGQCEQRRESHALSKANAALNTVVPLPWRVSTADGAREGHALDQPGPNSP